MAETAYKQMITTFIRQTKPQSFRTGKPPRYPQRSLNTAAAAIPTKREQDAQPWQQHRLPSSPELTDRSRLAALRSDPEPKSFSSFLTDNYARQHNYLRISVTERCNLRCLYCMPEEGVQLSPPEHNLTTPEIVYLSELFVKQGVDKIRLTGGEPTVRKDIVSLMQQIGQLRSWGLKELCITTNGISLHRKLDSMVESGLTGVNLSLDTLDPFQFTLMTRRNGHDAVMKSIHRILDMNKLGAGIKLKINCVVMKGLNEREIIPFVEMGKEKDLEVRFIEYMPFDGNRWSQNKMLSYQEMLAVIRARYPDVSRMQDHVNDTSKTYKIPGFAGRIGFITSMTHNFCGTCNRLRITSDGNLKVCLFGNSEVSLRDVLRQSNEGKPFDAEAMEALKQLESDRRVALEGSTGGLGVSEREARLLHIIGLAVKRKKEKHAGIGELENMKNRPMILIDEPIPARPSPVPSFHARNCSAMYSSSHSAVPLHLLPHPRHSFMMQQLRHRSTFLGRRTYQSARLVRYYIGPAAARQYKFDRKEFPTRIQSTRARKLTAYIRDRLVQCRRAFKPYPNPRTETTWTRQSAEELRAQAEKLEQPLTHLDETGAAHMVEISGKAETKRVATAVAHLFFSNFRTYDALSSQKVVKGNAIAVARLAAIQAAKKTSDLVPLAHPSLGITSVNVRIETFGPEAKYYIYKCIKDSEKLSHLVANQGHVTVTATVKCEGKTGVEMEAITAATIGAVTMYDMLKAIDKGLVIMGARVIRKEGGKSGSWKWDEESNELVKDEEMDSPLAEQDDAQPKGQSTPTAHPRAPGSKNQQFRASSSDIDEWNKGLADEFSVTGLTSTDAGGTAPNESKPAAESIRQNEPRQKESDTPTQHRPKSRGPSAPTSGNSKPLQENTPKSNSPPTPSAAAESNPDTIADILTSIKALESRLLAIQKSQFVAANTDGAAHRTLELDTPEDWRPETMSPITRQDLSTDQERVDAQSLRDARKRRFDENGGSSGGSIIR